jgi:cell envelope-related transcriptional attenuator-like protein
VISGIQALAFVRDRHGIGNSGDLGRIKMQQMFVSSLIKKVMGAGTLSDPVTLYRLADAATRSLTTHPGLGSVQLLLGLAESLRTLNLGQITFVTVPNELDPADIDRLPPRRARGVRGLAAAAPRPAVDRSPAQRGTGAPHGPCSDRPRPGGEARAHAKRGAAEPSANARSVRKLTIDETISI